MKVVVCGSRNWPDEHAVAKRMRELPAGSEVIHGAAPGVDRMAGHWAAVHGHTVREYPAHWETLGKSAGFARNLQMLRLRPDLVIAFQTDGSRGTQHTIDSARRRGIPVEIHTHNTTLTMGVGPQPNEEEAPHG